MNSESCSTINCITAIIIETLPFLIMDFVNSMGVPIFAIFHVHGIHIRKGLNNARIPFLVDKAHFLSLTNDMLDP